jgi:hypothetical protein
MTSVIEQVSAQDLLELLPYLSEAEREELDRLLTVGAPRWVPQVGPQTMALESQADILFYGGSAGGGKTDLLCGLACQHHEKSIIFRRQSVQLVGIEERLTEILGGRDGYNGQDSIWRLPNEPGLAQGRTLELGSVKEPGDWAKYQGRPHDFIGFDEITHFLEMQVRQLMGWKRTGKVGVRQRVVMAGNPPTDSDGEWVIRFFAPWLDPDHANPAKPGELRWFVSDADGKDQEVPNSRPVKVGSKWVQPHSRTFIPSAVRDNVFLMATGYEATLDALPEPFRSQMRDGSFTAGRMDEVNQVIPTAWIKAAQARWLPRPVEKGVMTAMGFDPARGGDDRSAISRRHGNWFDELLSVPGAATKDGPEAAAFAIQHVRDGAPIPLDAIGIGSSVLDYCNSAGLNVWPVVSSDGTTATDKSGRLNMRNLRALMYWRLREAMDPTNDDAIALPPDDELRADLAAQRFKLVTMGKRSAVLLLPKDQIREVLGRSPDKGDAVAMTFLDGLPAPQQREQARAFRNRSRITDWRAA